MKKIITLASVAIATIFAFSSCHKENLQDNGSTDGVRIITAEFENNATKTSLNSDGMTPEWEAGDRIRILNEISFQDVTLTANDITNNKITFTTTLTGTLYAVYPASATAMESCSDDNVSFTISATQDGTFASANICVAKSTEDDEYNKDNLIFRNATAVLKITTPTDVVKVDITAANSIAGTVTASFDGTAISLTTTELDENSVSAAATSAPSDNIFYLAAAPVTTGEATVTCYKVDKKVSTDKEDKALQKNVIYSMDLSSLGWKNKTIADILPDDFPGTYNEGWKNENNCSCFLNSNNTTPELTFSNNADLGKIIVSTKQVEYSDGEFVYNDESSHKITFIMDNTGNLSSITYGGSTSSDLDGTYEKPACIAAGTMITLENGGQKAVEELEIGDVIRTVDHETGTVSSAPVCFIWTTENASNVFTLTFEDGVVVDVIEEHGFYDREEQKYAFINADNAKDYIGHHFYNADNGQWLELKSSKMLNKRVDAYAIVTSKHLNHLSNGILSMCDGSIKVLANIFEYDSQLMFDADKKAANIAEYGLTSLEKVLEYKGFTEADYYNYNLQYLNVAIGKGLTTWDYVKALGDYCEANQIY